MGLTKSVPRALPWAELSQPFRLKTNASQGPNKIAQSHAGLRRPFAKTCGPPGAHEVPVDLDAQAGAVG